jgi:hypothetical protein
MQFHLNGFRSREGRRAAKTLVWIEVGARAEQDRRNLRYNTCALKPRTEGGEDRRVTVPLPVATTSLPACEMSITTLASPRPPIAEDDMPRAIDDWQMRETD